MTKYGRDPCDTRKYNPRNTRRPYNRHRQDRPAPPRGISSGNTVLSFDEARKRGLCMRCHEEWTPGHRCNGQFVRNQVRNRMRSGHHAIHVMAELIQALESQPDDSHPHEEAPPANATDTHVSNQEINEFDAALNGGLSETPHESTDTATAMYFLSGAFTTDVVDSPIESHAPPKNSPHVRTQFQIGGSSPRMFHGPISWRKQSHSQRRVSR